MKLLLPLVLTLLATTAAFYFMFWVGASRHGPRVTARLLVRLVVVFVPTAAAFYSMFWVGGALVFPPGFSPRITLVAPLLGAIAVTYYTCLRTPSFPPGLLGSVVLGAFVTGGIAFVAGFFGPMLFTPGSLHAPLLGLFLTGPAGFVLGAVGGAVFWLARHSRTTASSGHGAV